MLRTFTDNLLFIVVLALFLVPPASSKDPFVHSVIYASNRHHRLNDSLPHYRYRQAADSLNRISEKKKIWREGASYYEFFSIGLIRLRPQGKRAAGVPDSILQRESGDYFCIDNYRLKNKMTHDWEGDHVVLPALVGGTVPPNAKSPRERQALPVRYQLNDSELDLGRILVPLNGNAGLLEAIFVGIMVLTGLFLLYALVIRPFFMLRNLSRGAFFDARHARDLRLLGWTLVGMAVLPGLLTVSFGWMVRERIQGFVEIPAWRVLWDNKRLLAAGLAVLLLARAFRRGAELETDHQSIV